MSLHEPLSHLVEKPGPTIAFCENNSVGNRIKIWKQLLKHVAIFVALLILLSLIKINQTKNKNTLGHLQSKFNN